MRNTAFSRRTGFYYTPPTVTENRKLSMIRGDSDDAAAGCRGLPLTRVRRPFPQTERKAPASIAAEMYEHLQVEWRKFTSLILEHSVALYVSLGWGRE